MSFFVYISVKFCYNPDYDREKRRLVMLNITKEENGNEVTVILDGKVDTSASPALSEEVEPLMEAYDTIIFDLKDVLYVSSSGLRVFLDTDKKMIDTNKTVKFKNVPDSVMEIFDMTGFVGVLNFI